MGRNHIKQLTLGGFQVFADPVTFPLGPLTLLYGPNSAGKSALLDAMLALADLCELFTHDKPKLAADRRSAGRILERHWRREGAMQATPAKALHLGAVIRIGGREWAKGGFAKNHGAFAFIDNLGPMYPRFADCFSCLQPLAEAEQVDVEVLFQYALAKSEPLRADQDALVGDQTIDLGIGGSPILRWNGYWAAINLGHPALLSWKTAVDLKWMASRHADSFKHIGEWFAMSLCYLTDGQLGTNAVDSIEATLGENPSDVDLENHARVRGAEASFISMFDGLLQASLKGMRDTLRVPVVPASRAVPRTSELTFIFDVHGIPLSGEPLGLRMNGSPEHQDITVAAFVTELERCGIRKSPEDLFGKPTSRSTADAVGLVNRLLGDYLFRASGYFVAAGVHELIAPAGPEGLSANKQDADRKFLVSLELRDAAGRRFNFDEVGSGLGYVLPVLLAIATSEVAFLQQPELHLHPALQSELADALIVAMNEATFGGANSNGCKQIIAETHSEHLLLRLLRRVRQGADPERSLDPHSLGRENLVVLYVDPKSDGTSTVKHLRIARDGEFIDRWPKGFFEERWGELFDE